MHRKHLFSILLILVITTGCSNNTAEDQISETIRRPEQTEDTPDFEQKTEAEKTKTYLAEISGETHINDQIAIAGQKLYEGDTITVTNGTAQVVYFDDSVSRLQEGTTVQLTILQGEDFERGKSEILLDVATGQVWTKVQNFTSPNIQFQVKTAAVNATIRGSALDVFTDGECISVVRATEHTTDVTARGQTDNSVEILEGQQAQVTDTEKCPQQDLQTDNIVVADIPPEQQESNWFTANQEEDEEYQQRVRERIAAWRKEKVGALPGTPEYEEKRLADEKRLAAAFDRWKVELEIIERSILELETLLNEGETELAQVHQQLIQQKLLDLFKKYTENKDVQHQLQRILQQSKQRTRQILPHENEYIAKNFIRDLEISFAPDAERQELQKRALRQQILDIYDLSKQEDIRITQETLQQLKIQLLQKLQNDPEFIYILKAQLENPYLERILRKGGIADKKLRELLQEFLGDEIITRSELQDLIQQLKDREGLTAAEVEALQKLRAQQLQAGLQRQQEAARQQEIERLKKEQEAANATSPVSGEASR